MCIKKVLFRALVVSAIAVSLVSCGGKKTAADPAPAPRTMDPSPDGGVVINTATNELEDLKLQLEEDNILAAIGEGESNKEQMARTKGVARARTELARSISLRVQSLLEDYSMDVQGESKEITEDAAKQVSDEVLSGSTVYKTIVQYYKDSGQYKATAIVVLNPSLLKKSFEESFARNEELELRVKKDDLMKKLDAEVEKYNEKYKNKK
jgi:hypothetical protein